MSVADQELVVLLDDSGKEIGEAPKRTVHGSNTPLHLAFSCYLLDSEGRLLVTRRAVSKRTWPGVWTNSFCGHPAPGEEPSTAVHRRAKQELGARIASLELVLPDFRYRAVDASGIVENEMCPVYLARIDGPVLPSPTEVEEWAWADPQALGAAVALAPFAFSPWLAEQLPQLVALDAFEGPV